MMSHVLCPPEARVSSTCVSRGSISENSMTLIRPVNGKSYYNVASFFISEDMAKNSYT
jgi:hypothetical protein